MEVVIKVFSGVFFVVCLAALGAGVVGASADARNANLFAAECGARIEDSHYAESVIEACRQDAEKMGYELTVGLYEPKGWGRPMGGSYSLTYRYEIPIVGIGRQCVVRGDLR